MMNVRRFALKFSSTWSIILPMKQRLSRKFYSFFELLVFWILNFATTMLDNLFAQLLFAQRDSY